MSSALEQSEHSEPAVSVARQTRDLVRLEDVGVQRGNRWLVRGVSFSVKKGEIVTLIGPNGSGKSTTAKLALGLIKASHGRVTRAPGTSVGYVPQSVQIDRALPMTLSRLICLTRHHSANDINDALALVGIAHMANRQVHDLSGGEFQRALIARALVAKPELLVLDEPVQGVDFNGEIQMYDLISEIRDQIQCGVLLISHDLHIVMAKTDSVICLNGHVCCQGSPQTVAGSPEYVELFGHHGAQALAIYQHHHDHTHLPDGSIDSSADAREHHHDHQHD